jgi:hypothetical protein
MHLYLAPGLHIRQTIHSLGPRNARRLQILRMKTYETEHSLAKFGIYRVSHIIMSTYTEIHFVLIIFLRKMDGSYVYQP